MRYDLGRFRRPMRRSTEGQLASLVGLGDGSTLSLDFTAMSSLDSRFTFTRASTTSTFINSSGLVATAGTNVARFDHNPTTLAPRGLLIEGSVTNLVLQSDTLTTPTNWVANTLTRTNVSTVTPDGNTTATTCGLSHTGSGSFRSSPITVTASTAYTFSFWAKNNGGSVALYRAYNVSGSADIVAETSYFSQINGSTWTRVQFTFTTPVGCTSVYVYPLSQSSGTSNVLIWGAQLEAGSGASSYVASGASQGQRAADVCTMSGTNFSSWYGTPTAFTTVFEGAVVSQGGYIRILNFSSGVNTAGTVPNFNVGIPAALSNRPFMNAYIVSSANVDAYVPVGGAVTNGVAFKLAVRCQATLHRITRGTSLSASSSYNGFPSGLANLYLGGTDGAYQVATWYSKLKFFPIAISDSQMDVLAT